MICLKKCQFVWRNINLMVPILLLVDSLIASISSFLIQRLKRDLAWRDQCILGFHYPLGWVEVYFSSLQLLYSVSSFRWNMHPKIYHKINNLLNSIDSNSALGRQSIRRGTPELRIRRSLQFESHHQRGIYQRGE